ncbi:GNAT family N-acetyltransferase [Saccharospirillum alexandrii]|uniref:GNAT family N-acetyltransferase n=1 Tax=Saccharospirillum alexandrii TaxID=2448477 RepID=UPI0037364303
MPTVTWHAHWAAASGAQHNPFLRSSFLSTLEQTGVCSENSGWQPEHLSLNEGDQTLWMPMYAKTHSWGEYVFDWSWAHAYEQHGLPYYPKLVAAIPYTPSQGPRATQPLTASQVTTLAGAIEDRVRDQAYSGAHLLFPDTETARLWRQTGWAERCDVQFHWKNRNYRDFDDFLDRFSSRKRKNTRKERRSIADQGLSLRCFEGTDISLDTLHRFYVFYHATYLKRGRQGYLNRAFFEQLLARQPETLVLFMAYEGEEAVAGALCFRDNTSLYGRYWGCLAEYNNLHFETCYYQGIDYCIRNGLQRFDPGTQGEHKVARGFEPTLTHSFHWLAHPDFRDAVQRFCDEEAEMVAHYRQQMMEALPFKATADGESP